MKTRRRSITAGFATAGIEWSEYGSFGLRLASDLHRLSIQSSLIRWALAEFGFLLIRIDGVLQVAQFERFIRTLAPLEPSERPTTSSDVSAFIQIRQLSAADRLIERSSQYLHHDMSYRADPAMYTGLYLCSGGAGSATFFFDSRTACEIVCKSKSHLVSKDLVHSNRNLLPQQLSPDGGQPKSETAIHPVVRRHPVSGDQLLFSGTLHIDFQYGAHSLLDPEENRELLDEATTHPGVLLEHRWQPRDLVIWDNWRVMHRAELRNLAADRVMWRAMTVGPERAGLARSAQPANPNAPA